ncbi:MBL fold metallo-hydrolase [Nocardia stercoris]|uniref:MBL fold metallo-hydrolase n=1 Tax=Nocardia stercoris TaxID=2483361 RepID=A0A3M2KUV3_9NOCA|nr:MBL fold metallo-hydrolase [Nocardia stercoris]RMI29427.1 MBL fold metallo-hydrolase [Nocardia stercoris]
MTNTLHTTLELVHVGGPTVRFTYGGLTWLVDPTFDQPGEYRSGALTLRKLTGPAVSAAEIGPIDVALLSHDQHPDNLDPTGRQVLATAGTVLSTPEAAGRIDGVRGMTVWEDVRIGEVTVTAVPALHGPEGAEELSGTVTGFVLRAPGEPVVYVSGDNASVDLVEQIVARIGRIDIALLNVGAANVGRFGDIDVTLNARTAARAAQILGDAAIVSVHAEGWAHFTETLDRLRMVFDDAGIGARLHIPVPGEVTAIGA